MQAGRLQQKINEGMAKQLRVVLQAFPPRRLFYYNSQCFRPTFDTAPAWCDSGDRASRFSDLSCWAYLNVGWLLSLTMSLHLLHAPPRIAISLEALKPPSIPYYFTFHGLPVPLGRSRCFFKLNGASFVLNIRVQHYTEALYWSCASYNCKDLYYLQLAPRLFPRAGNIQPRKGLCQCPHHYRQQARWVIYSQQLELYYNNQPCKKGGT